MKKFLFVVLLLILVIFIGCTKEEKVLKIGATAVPHAEILEFIKDDFEKESGYKLEIVVFNDYVQPNIALEEEQIDANYFQHVPYLEEFSKSKGYKDLISIAKIHVEPMGFYSKKSIKEFKSGDKVVIPNDATNEGRALLLLQENGLIKLKDTNSLKVTINDIEENKYNLDFVELDAAYLPRTYKEDTSVIGAVINTNYAIENGLNPLKDAIFIENANSPYANIIAVKEKNKDNKEIQLLIKLLQSKKVKDFILEKYKGAVVPTF
ncbi:D-methionine transport system substrate-binding protein [Marinitoga hydrogenitolerans DSM 16785]|uniref:D-methionine transport system substrate-binding protein n=1 Tax=Marinitoga hydrogenitolerans (strain DSM 16785 / JCM 12826 / AT1271) TaxID=1122195 RepID=A0A1M4SYI3_MARH1|nr:MetQ/NlpA family ABC transporter substrate-binding protein [Marinitoga hydrogenitolerans]SHE37261.1 D-methionine transport system substrate-binding protein [Marinitoga hydrogenitolerans DSM 16785]